jgi:hypothetical protein
MKPEADNLGSWNVEDLRQTALYFAGLGADDKLPKDVRFLTNVAKLIAERDIVDGDASDPRSPAVFLLAPFLPEGISETTNRVPMLNNGATMLNGQVWLVSAVVNSGLKIERTFSDDDELFNFVIGSLNLGDVPAIIYEPRSPSPTIRFYPTGLEKPDECVILPAKGEEVTDERIFSVIDGVYQQCLKTPDAQSRAGKLWKRPERCWPSSNAEAVVQLNLKAGLAGQFLTCIIREEQTTAEGRTDLEIEEKDPVHRGIIIRHALIELKVLRSFHESGSEVLHSYTLDWVESGVEQAHEFGKKKGARLATLCCFDMRTEDDKGSCFEHVLEKANHLEVVLKRWYIYSSSERYRKAMAG